MGTMSILAASVASLSELTYEGPLGLHSPDSTALVVAIYYREKTTTELTNTLNTISKTLCGDINLLRKVDCLPSTIEDTILL